MGHLLFDIAHLLAGGLVLLSLVLLYQDRLTSLLNVFALHAVVLAASVSWQAYAQAAPISMSRRRSPFCSRRSSFRSPCTA